MKTANYKLVRTNNPKCDDTTIGNGKQNHDETSCKQRCDDTTNCNFIYISDKGLCIMWETCDEEKSGKSGKLLQKITAGGRKSIYILFLNHQYLPFCTLTY